MNLKLSELAQALTLQLPVADDDVVVRSISIDSRTLQDGACFVALKGPHFDGHQFVRAAEQQGAVAIVAAEPVPTQLPLLLVEDTHQALKAIAAIFRRHFRGKVTALTGSCGKTTVKTMIAAILQQLGETLATEGNKNNEIGVPLTLYRLSAHHQYAVLEMGANGLGEIERLTALAKPDVALITNVNPVHLQGFKTVEGIAKEKGDIYSGLSAGTGTAVIFYEDGFRDYWLKRCAGKKIITFGAVPGCDVRAADIKATERGSEFTLHAGGESITIQLALLGRHNVLNATAAAAACLAQGATLQAIQTGLASVQPVAGRLVSKKNSQGITIIDDTYNSNPQAVNAAIEVLLQQPSTQKWLVLADMGELGDQAVNFHKAVGSNAKLKGVDRLWTCGSLAANISFAFGEGGRHFDSKEALINALQAAITTSDLTILVKGSRSEKMEEVVAAMTQKVQETAPC